MWIEKDWEDAAEGEIVVATANVPNVSVFAEDKPFRLAGSSGGHLAVTRGGIFYAIRGEVPGDTTDAFGSLDAAASQTLLNAIRASMPFTRGPQNTVGESGKKGPPTIKYVPGEGIRIGVLGFAGQEAVAFEAMLRLVFGTLTPAQAKALEPKPAPARKYTVLPTVINPETKRPTLPAAKTFGLFLAETLEGGVVMRIRDQYGSERSVLEINAKGELARHGDPKCGTQEFGLSVGDDDLIRLAKV